MTPHRSPEETLRAENERLRAEVASLRAKPAKVALRWAWPAIHDKTTPGFIAMLRAIWWGIWAGILAVFFLVEGAAVVRLPIFARVAVLLAPATLVWCLAFVRRVPR